MRATRFVSGFASWRWMPCCALITGSLLYVALIVLVVPKNLGKLPGTLSAPVGAQSDMLTTNALGHRASLPSHHAPATHTLATVDLGDNTPPEPASPPRHLTESRAAALGSPPPMAAPRPPPPRELPPAPPPPPAEEPGPPAPDNEPPAEPAPPHPVIQRFMGGIHMIPPHLSAPAANRQPAANDQPADNNNDNAGGAGNNEEPQ